jgi:hypothetical protein
MPTDLLNGALTSLMNFAAASGGLGTAAYGLVDVTKAFGGGISNVGFSHIKKSLQPFDAAFREIGNVSPLDTLRAHWLNSVPQDDQKAAAKSLIHLGLSPGNASDLAESVGVDPDALTVAAEKKKTGAALLPEEANVLERFDAIIDAVLNGAYERGDQQYRNASKAASAVAAIILAVVGGGTTHAQDGQFSLQNFVFSQDFLVAILVGFTASPLAPMAKDLSSLLAGLVRPTGAAKP